MTMRALGMLSALLVSSSDAEAGSYHWLGAWAMLALPADSSITSPKLHSHTVKTWMGAQQPCLVSRLHVSTHCCRYKKAGRHALASWRQCNSCEIYADIASCIERMIGP